MKRTRRIAGWMLVLAMTLAMTMSALAVEVDNEASVTVTIDEGLKDHSFVAYRVFKGTQTGIVDDTALGDVEWGDDVYSAGILTDLSEKYPDAVSASTTAAQLAELLAKDDDESAQEELARAFAKIVKDHLRGEGTPLTAGTNQLKPGYYLIVDKTSEMGDGDSYNAALLQMTGSVIHIQAKMTKPSVEKKVKEDDRAVAELETGGSTNYEEKYGEKYNDVADYGIGDQVPFAFYSAVPDMEYYDGYYYALHDTMSSGLSLNEDTVEVTVVHLTKDAAGTVTDKTTIPLTVGTDYTLTKETGGFSIVIEDLKKLAQEKGFGKEDPIRVDFTATLTEAAVTGSAGNTNSVSLEYSNKPDDPTGRGNTPQDQVVVFTYELDATKIDGETGGETPVVKLANAAFRLYYETEETVEGEAVEVRHYAKLAGGTDDERKVSGWTENAEEASEIHSDTDGNFKIAGLDSGTYYLEETKAPAGYNKLTAPIKFTITPTIEHEQDLTSGKDALTGLTITVDGEAASEGSTLTGIVTMDVANFKGVTLPETGGIGTTVFYAGGALLVLLAGVILVARKRAGKERNS